VNGSLGSGWVQHFAILHIQNDLLAGTSPRDAALNYVELVRIAERGLGNASELNLRRDCSVVGPAAVAGMHEKFLTLFVFIAGSLRLSKRACPCKC
jgi:hypothetical protein